MAAREHVRIGAHLNGGVNKATAHADRIGLRAGPIQLFARSPSGWRTPNHKDAAVGKFRAACAERELGPAFIHGIYLMNFASLDERIYGNSLEALTAEFRVASRLGVAGIVIHPGAAKGQSVPEALDRAAGALRHCLDATADDAGEVELLLETCAGQGTTLGRSFEELAGLLERLDHDPRVTICLDTCHMHAAGYSLTPHGQQSAYSAGSDRCTADREVAQQGRSADRLTRRDGGRSATGRWVYRGCAWFMPTIPRCRSAPIVTATRTSATAQLARRILQRCSPTRRCGTCHSSWKCRASTRRGRTRPT